MSQIPEPRRVRIRNVKSNTLNYFLSLEGPPDNWTNDNASLTIRAFDNSIAVDRSPQVWTAMPYDGALLLYNQCSGLNACIRDRSAGNGATAIQYHRQVTSEKFQQWQFLPRGDSFLVQNVNSGKFIGPQNREITNDHYVIQYDAQLDQDDYQLWVIEDM